VAQFIDFADLKAKLTFGETVQLLGLEFKQSGNQWRGACPVCKGAAERSLVITDGKGWFCFIAHKGGDQIALASHILGIGMKEAALHLAEQAGMVPVQSTSTSTKDTSPPSTEDKGEGLEPLCYLEPDHEAVVSLGFDPEWCSQHGVGYAPKGVCRGSVAIPFRDDHGVLLGYIAVQDVVYLPPDFQSNVVPLRKRA
jgi:DNA primase